MAINNGTDSGSLTSGSGRSDAVISGFVVDYIDGGSESCVIGCRDYSATLAFPGGDFTADFFLPAWAAAIATARSLPCLSPGGAAA